MNVLILLKVGFNISKLTDQIPHLQLYDLPKTAAMGGKNATYHKI